ncbi:hypothetical protein [Allosalinactinospora lopnorensis]|uniref:hypothetical protein n=1 Tax=Allosalinactinospora lopnorensis TaxID=1352348 RepID=UPI0012E2D23C|nr:hypothetical protein [Allosalinactinospora lopnorensis]
MAFRRRFFPATCVSLAPACAAMPAIAQTTADGSMRRVDPERAHDIPPRGDPILEDGETPAHPLSQDDLD